MIIVGKSDSEGFLPSERLDVYDAKPDIDSLAIIRGGGQAAVAPELEKSLKSG